MTFTLPKRRRILILLVALNLGLPASIVVIRHINNALAYHHSNEVVVPLFSDIPQTGIDMSSDRPVVRRSDTLRLSFYAQFDSQILPSSVALTSVALDGTAPHPSAPVSGAPGPR